MADQHVILTGSPANFYEMAFSGAEDANITQTSNLFVNGGSGTIATVAHTGAQSLLLGTSGVKGFTYSVPTSNLVAGRTYKASVWVKPAAGGNSNVGLYYDINGTIQTSVSSTTSTQTGTNSWVLVNLVIPGSAITPGNTLTCGAGMTIRPARPMWMTSVFSLRMPRRRPMYTIRSRVSWIICWIIMMYIRNTRMTARAGC